jgi:acyl-coenzyme A synthetase/AMP-(fatty) acid ligase
VTAASPAFLPLLKRSSNSIIAWRDSRAVTSASFLGDVYACADNLPDADYACIACKDQYLFMVAFCAVILKRQCNLLPANHRRKTLNDTLDKYANSYLLHDQSRDDQVGRESYSIETLCDNSSSSSEIPEIPADHVAAVVFTSGSTGNSISLQKSWRMLVNGAHINLDEVRRMEVPVSSIVSTVPPWHMYGLEWSMMVTLISDIGVHSGNSLFPSDVDAALRQTDGPTWLITTPLHMNAFLESDIEFPGVSLIMCATSPLDPALAATAESRFGARLLEIYGCSEAGAVARREPTRDTQWSFLENFSLVSASNPVVVSAEHIMGEVVLGDILEFDRDGKFSIVGRPEDLVKVGGKRASLQNLTKILLSIEGVQDGIFFVRPAEDKSPGRLAAFAVAPGQPVATLRTALAAQIDPVFMPRPLRRVSELPREPSGKLPRTRLLELWRTIDQSNNDE